MKTIGEYLKQERLRQGIKLSQVSQKTKIRIDYLQAIENNQFIDLPSAAFVKGFIQNYARSLGLNSQTALAIFRRDFDQNQQGRIIPRGLSRPFKLQSSVWNPKTTTTLITIAIVLFVIAYAVYQLLFYSSAPQINLFQPKEIELHNNIVEIKGRVSKDAMVTVNKQPVATNLDGYFSTTLNLSSGQHTLLIEATGQNGKKGSLKKDIVISP
jgi:cytoskeletal protein RodZ